MWQRGERSDRIFAFARSANASASLKRHAGVRPVVRAIERMNASTVAVQHRDSGTVGVEHGRSFGVTLPGTAATLSLAASTASAAGRRCVGNVSAHDVGAPMNAPPATIVTLETCFTI